MSPCKNQAFKSYTSLMQYHEENMIFFRQRKDGNKQAKTQARYDWITAGLTPNPVVPCLGCGALDGTVWAAVFLGGCNSGSGAYRTHRLSPRPALLHDAVLGTHSSLLVSPISWGLHCNLGFTFSASCHGLLRPTYSKSDLTQLHTAWLQ